MKWTTDTDTVILGRANPPETIAHYESLFERTEKMKEEYSIKAYLCDSKICSFGTKSIVSATGCWLSCRPPVSAERLSSKQGRAAKGWTVSSAS